MSATRSQQSSSANILKAHAESACPVARIDQCRRGRGWDRAAQMAAQRRNDERLESPNNAPRNFFNAPSHQRSGSRSPVLANSTICQAFRGTLFDRRGRWFEVIPSTSPHFLRRRMLESRRIFAKFKIGWELRSAMCDYSLHHVKSRPAKVGDKLTTRNFHTGTRGFASPDDRTTAVGVLM
jgi:hypothetical protein